MMTVAGALFGLETRMSLERRRNEIVGSRSLGIIKTYLKRGQSASHSVWIRVSPKNPLMKAALALPIGALMLMMLILILIALGFTLMAVALMSGLSRGKENTEGG